MTAQEWQRSEGERQLLFTGFLYFLLSSRVRTGLSYPVCTRRDKRGSKKKKMRNGAKLEVGRQKTEWGVAGTTALWDDPTWTCYLNFPPSCRKWFDLVTRLSVSHSNLGGRELCVEAGQITTFGSLCCSGHEATAEFISCLSLSLYYNYHTWESWLDMTSMFHVRLELLVCADSVCVCVRAHMLQSTAPALGKHQTKRGSSISIRGQLHSSTPAAHCSPLGIYESQQ